MKPIARREFIKISILGIPTLIACSKSSPLLIQEIETLGAFEADATGSFSFVQVSDTHIEPVFTLPDSFEGLRSFQAVQTIPKLGALPMPNADSATLAPEFLIHTGDMGEFGLPGVTDQVLDRYFEAYDKPKYWIFGNHDNTWVTQTQRFHQQFGGVSYTFDRNGVRFIGLNSATFQEPLPSFAEETILFLRETLINTPVTMPLILFWHHPFSGDYFASEYDKERVLDELSQHHVALVLNGHFHSAQYQDMGRGIDSCVATATFSRTAEIIDGYSVVDLQQGRLRVVDVRAADNSKVQVLLDKDIRVVPEKPVIKFIEPAFRAKYKSDTLRPAATINLKRKPAAAFFLNGKPISNTYNGLNEPNGSHNLRVEYKAKSGEVYQKSSAFQWERPHPYSPQTKWSVELGAASVATPLYHDGIIVIGTNNGEVNAFNADNGKPLWKNNKLAGGLEVLRKAAAYKRDFLVGTGSGEIFRIQRNGSATALPVKTNAVYCPLLVEGDMLYYGNQDANLVAFDLEKNAVAWINRDARFTIESRPVAAGNEILFTAWDGFLYSVNRETGMLNWRAAGPRNAARERGGSSATRYYAPADVSPVVVGNRIYLCDRGYNAAAYSNSGEHLFDFEDDVSAITASADGSRLFLRRWKQPFCAVDLEVNPLWTSNIILGRLPVEPTLCGNLVLATNHTGTMFAFDQNTGEAKWTYNVTPQLFVLGSVEVDTENKTAFAVGMDGVLKAIDLESLAQL